MKEDLISEETAILAEQIGCELQLFGRGYEYVYLEGNVRWTSVKNGLSGEENTSRVIKCSQSLLQKWLRDVHNIDVWAQPFVMNKSLPDESYSYFIYKDGVWQNDGVNMLSFEEALEKGLQESLKLIKDKITNLA